MPEGTELDLEIVSLSKAYTLYAAALLALSTAYNRGERTTEAKQAVRRHGQELREAGTICGLALDIPLDFDSAAAIKGTLSSGAILNDISNQLVSRHSRRQENLFLFAATAGGIATGEVGGLGEEMDAARQALVRINTELKLPKRLVKICSNKPEECFKELSKYLRRPKLINWIVNYLMQIIVAVIASVIAGLILFRLIGQQ